MQQIDSVRPSVLWRVRYPDEARLRRYMEQGVLNRETLAGGFRTPSARTPGAWPGGPGGRVQLRPAR